MKWAKHVWFTNFPGIGNTVMLMPVLAALENQFPRLLHFHTESPVYRDEWFLAKSGLKNLAGLSALEWRRFNPSFWPAINHFLNRNAIDVVVNLRNEGPKYDRDYYLFKEKGINVAHQVRFIDFDFPSFELRSHPRNLFLDIVDLVLPMAGRLPHQTAWLPSDRDNRSRDSVGFGLAASQRNKRWSHGKWSQLAKLLCREPKRKILLFPGISESEVQQATELASEVGSVCHVVLRQPLSRVANLIGAVGCFVSNDTGLLHIAVASGIPAVGIYTNTNPEIWAPFVSEGFRSFTNLNMFKCEHLKPISGNCVHYYDTCPALQEFADSIEPTEVAMCVVAALAS